jgi:hypothetical protein
MSLEIQEPIDITVKNNVKTEENNDTFTDSFTTVAQKKKKVATEAQLRGLEKARQARLIKQKALQMLNVREAPKAQNVPKPIQEYHQTITRTQHQAPLESGILENLSSFVEPLKTFAVPFLCLLGLSSVYVLKKKNMMNSSPDTQENVQTFSTLQLGF